VQARLGHRLEVGLSYGVHPQVAGAAPGERPGMALDEQLAALDRAARGEPLTAGEPPLPRPQAIGELGLHATGKAPPERLQQQERAFRAQLALARQLDLPLVLHVVRTHAEVLRILKSDGVPRAGGVVHSYSGSAELVADYVRLGLHLSFAGPVTYPDAHRVQAAARAVPAARLLVETDAPDQTPWARRPAPCEPAFLPDIVQALAAHRGTTPAELARFTDSNARQLFALPPPVSPDVPGVRDAAQLE
jgi:TatD DNase family protein